MLCWGVLHCVSRLLQYVWLIPMQELSKWTSSKLLRAAEGAAPLLTSRRVKYGASNGAGLQIYRCHLHDSKAALA